MCHRVYAALACQIEIPFPKGGFVKWVEKASPRVPPGPSTLCCLKARKCPEQVSALTKNSFWASSTGFFLSKLSGPSDLYDSRGRKY